MLLLRHIPLVRSTVTHIALVQSTVTLHCRLASSAKPILCTGLCLSACKAGCQVRLICHASGPNGSSPTNFFIFEVILTGYPTRVDHAVKDKYSDRD